MLKLNGMVQKTISDRIMTVVETIKERARQSLAENENKTILVRRGYAV